MPVEVWANIIREKNLVLFEHVAFPLNILITLVFMHMYLLSWRVSRNGGGLEPTHCSGTQHDCASELWEYTAAELWWIQLWSEIIGMMIRHHYIIIYSGSPGLLFGQIISEMLTSLLVSTCLWGCVFGIERKCCPRIKDNSLCLEKLVILHEFLTASVISSFGDRVTDNSSVPKFFSGYWGSFRSNVTSRVLQKSTEIVLI